jgi:hypothetical protein
VQIQSGSVATLDDQGRRIVEALGGLWQAHGAMCRCPAHADRTPSLSIRPGRRRLLLHCFAGCEAEAVIRALRASGLLDFSNTRAAQTPSAASKPRSLSPLAARLWSEARPLSASLAERYLQGRGIDVASPDLRYHSRTPHGRAPLTSFRPALIAAVRDDTGLVGVHRTFLETFDRRTAPVPVA